MTIKTTTKSSSLLASDISLTVLTVDGAPYTMATARGWCSGPCERAQEAIERVCAWEDGESIAEAPEGMASTSQMLVARQLLSTTHVLRDGGAMLRSVEAALAAGICSAEWVVGTRAVVRLIRHPEMQAAEETMISRG